MLGIKTEQEDGGYISSDPEDRGGMNQDIDDINFEDEDDDAAEGSAHRQRRHDAQLPVRVIRKEHKQRTIGINTEASSAEAADLLEKAEEASKGDKSFVAALADVTAAKKAKVKTKEVEVIGSSRRWKGVYEEEDDDDDNDIVKVKAEPVDDDAVMLGSEDTPEERQEIDPSNAEGHDQEQAVPGSGEDMSLDIAPEEEVKVKVEKRRRVLRRVRPATFQSEEEKREWEKQEDDFATMQDELGRINVSDRTTQDAESGEAQTQVAGQTNKRQDAIYLFQFPPVLLDLVPPAVKKETISPELRAKKPIVGDTEDQAIKLEDDEFGGENGTRRRQPKLPAGKAGKLRVYKSGRATLTWGGTCLLYTSPSPRD